MSTKINARSPFYLSYTTPVAPTPEFTCSIADATGFEVDQEGVISSPRLSFGTIKSFTSSDAGFNNDKYATVTTATTRTVVFKINIPSGFSNSSAGTLDCTLTTEQPAKVTSGSTPSCLGGPTTNGSIPNQTIASGGNTVTINLASYFSQGLSAIAGYRAINYSTSFVQMSITGSTLTLTSLNLGGVKTVYVRAFDNDANTCTAVQAIQVTVNSVNALGCTSSSGVTSVGLVGGSITAAGVITQPDTLAPIDSMSLTEGGSTITSVSANTSSSAQNVTIYFNFTVPAGYSNAGATLRCPKELVQQGTSLPTFTCDDAGFSGQAIYDSGTINVGKAEKGTITGVTPVKFDPVQSDTLRTINLSITIPTGFDSAGSAKSGGCDLSLLQPAELSPFGNKSFYLSLGFPSTSTDDFCRQSAALTRIIHVKSTALDLTSGKNNTVATTDANGNGVRLFNGGDDYYAVDEFFNTSPINQNSGRYFLWRITQSGVITEVWAWDCEGGSNGNGYRLG
jgi:hypothetical protein